MSLRRSLTTAALLVIAAIGGRYYYVYAQAHPATNDAYLDMNVTHIAAQISGPVQTLAVRSHQKVHGGDLLFSIDPAPFRLAVDEAQARLQQAKDALNAADAKVTAAQAQVDAAQATLNETRRHAARVRDLVKKGTVSQDDGDATERALKDAGDSLAAAKAAYVAAVASRGAPGDLNAAVKAAQALLGQAQLDLQHTRVLAPADGILGSVDIRPGGYVDAGKPLFALVETGEVWVDANFKESDLVHIRPGQSAQISVDLEPGRAFRGRVESLSPASGTAFSLLPPENATGNWVKVTQRFPVRIRVLNPAAGLRLGASSEVTVDTTAVPD
jgi:membrane fusion protein, multidrug efflux system